MNYIELNFLILNRHQNYEGTMKAISIRNVPENVYAGLQEMAKTNRRSLQEQIKLILEQEVTLNKRSFLADAAEWRKKFQRRQFKDSVKDVRKDRQR
jgi:plasmid stability protein